MSIIRINKRTRYVAIDSRTLEDDRLSWKARGLLAYLLTRPDDWRVRMGHLERQSPDGAHALRTGMRELVEVGYIERRAIPPHEGGGTEYIVYEHPSCRDAENHDLGGEKGDRDDGFPALGKSRSRENRTLPNKDNKKAKTENKTSVCVDAKPEEAAHARTHTREAENDPVGIVREFFPGAALTAYQREKVRITVTDMDRWRRLLDFRAANGGNPRRHLGYWLTDYRKNHIDPDTDGHTKTTRPQGVHAKRAAFTVTDGARLAAEAIEIIRGRDHEGDDTPGLLPPDRLSLPRG